MKLFVAFLFCLAYVQWTLGQNTSNYCSRSLCSGLRHIACGNRGGYGSRCSSDAGILDISPYQQSILDRFNRYRNKVAGGNLPGFDSAIRMATMDYDEELQYLATLNVVNCDTQHDECRNTDRFRNSGQNIAYRWDPRGSSPTAHEAVLWAIDYWFEEHQMASMSVIDRYYSGTNAEHFTIMVAERNVAVGCAVLEHSEGGGVTMIVVCNFATTNIFDRPIYRRGPTASRCQEGTNPEYPNLCEITERYNVNSNRW